MLRTRGVNPALDPGGRGKGLDTVCARLATVRFKKVNPFKNQAIEKYENLKFGFKLSGEIRYFLHDFSKIVLHRGILDFWHDF